MIDKSILLTILAATNLKKVLFYIVFSIITNFAFSQNKGELANGLYEQNEFEKAQIIYEELTSDQPDESFFYQRYVQCLVKTNNQKKAVKFIRKKAKKQSDPLIYMIDECWVLSTDEKTKKESENLFELINGKITNDLEASIIASEHFEKYNLLDYAIKILQTAEANFGNIPEISNTLANLYLSNGQRIKAMERYLTLMVRSSIEFEQFKQVFESNITDSADIVALQQLLLLKIQENPYVTSLSEWLKWTFVKLQDWKNAFVYTKSIDIRLKEDGKRVFELGLLCKSNNELAIALKCFEYCTKLGINGHDPNLSQSNYLEVKYLLLQQKNGSNIEWNTLIAELKAFENENGPSIETLPIAETLSQIYIERRNNPDSSVFLLEKYLENPQIQKKNLAQAKISLAKAYIANNEMWQSELLFAQVEKDYSEESLGQIAKYNRAELSFFRGDYDWSLMQLDVLKDATTQLISNDAMELALCITDNVASDSNYMPLQLYSKALLFFRQHRFDSALYYAEKVKSNYPGHSLTDEVLMLKAKIFEQQELFDKAVDTYETISIAFAHDILVDNALFALANLYQYKLNNSEKAQISYKKIIENHSNSIFIVDARREFRKLRGF